MTGAVQNAAAALLDRPELAGEVAVLSDTGETTTYGALSDRVARFAGALRAAGLARGDRVVCAMPNTSDAAVALLAGMRIGAVPVPVFHFAQSDEIAAMARRAGAVALIAGGRAADRIPDLRAALADLRWTMAAGPGAAADLCFADAEAAADPLPAEPVGADALAFVAFSSGSTGTPKGLPHTHGNVLAVADSAVPLGFGGLAPGDRMLCSSPFGFSYALAGLIFYPFRFGAASLFSAERMTPETACRLLVRHRVTHWTTVPTLCAQILDWPDAPAAFPDLRVVKVGGMAASVELQTRWFDRFGVEMLPAFGMQELIGSALSNLPERSRRGTLGVPQIGCAAAILDEDERPMDDGTPGRLALRADFRIPEYWRDPDRSARTLRPGGWILTDDIAWRDADGFYHHVGRADQTIITSGWTVAPAEVEAALLAHPSVAEAVVLAMPDDLRGAVPVAAVTLTAPVDASTLQDHVSERLAAFKRPRHIAVMDALPRTNTGKPALAEIRARIERHVQEDA